MSAKSFWSRCNVSGIAHKGEEFLKFVGPGLLVTVGFIDPGNWAANLAAGAEYGYSLLWMVSLSTFMLIVLQHNAAHCDGQVHGRGHNGVFSLHHWPTCAVQRLWSFGHDQYG